MESWNEIISEQWHSKHYHRILFYLKHELFNLISTSCFSSENKSKGDEWHYLLNCLEKISWCQKFYFQVNTPMETLKCSVKLFTSKKSGAKFSKQWEISSYWSLVFLSPRLKVFHWVRFKRLERMKLLSVSRSTINRSKSYIQRRRFTLNLQPEGLYIFRAPLWAQFLSATD